MINASFTQSNTFPKIVSAAIDMIFQKSLLANSALNEDDGPIKKVGKIANGLLMYQKTDMIFRLFTRFWSGAM